VFSQLDSVIPAKKQVVELNQTDAGDIQATISQFVGELITDTEKKNPRMKDTKESAQKEFVKALNGVAQPVKSGVSYNGYSCDLFELSGTNKSGQKEKFIQLWAVPPSMLNMALEDFQASRGLFDLCLYLIHDSLLPLGIDVDALKGYPWYREYPVMMVIYDKGKPQFIYRVLSVTPQTFTPDTFSIPQDYEKSDMLTLLKTVFSKMKATKTESSQGVTVKLQPQGKD
ncbi:MAG TPA: hypothetical protein VJ873_07145, partial [bacterium]|nr:hypothetical protein [bacterium]